MWYLKARLAALAGLVAAILLTAVVSPDTACIAGIAASIIVAAAWR